MSEDNTQDTPVETPVEPKTKRTRAAKVVAPEVAPEGEAMPRGLMAMAADAPAPLAEPIEGALLPMTGTVVFTGMRERDRLVVRDADLEIQYALGDQWVHAEDITGPGASIVFLGGGTFRVIATGNFAIVG